MSSQLGTQILEYLNQRETVNSLDLANLLNEDHQKIIGSIKSLESIENLIETKLVSEKKWILTDEGKYIGEHGSHEAVIFNGVPENGTSQQELISQSRFGKIGFSKALATGWIYLDKSSGKPVVRRKVSSISDVTRNDLKNIVDIEKLPNERKDDYKKRKLIQEVTIKSTEIRKGKNFSTKIEKLEADLTTDLLINNAWKEKKFKPYNFDALGTTLETGHLHPLLKVRSEFRKIFLEMGFTEMPTNNFVESSFWNFDALFQPQQHPARDAHDTFFISEPRTSDDFPLDYLEKVKKVHSQGGYGSQGYGYDWKLEEAKKNLLRTHTTAVSARMLYKLMKQSFSPVKYFSIDRVFRNETLDATHLAEFHQIEGVVADYDLNLGHLIGILYEFFKKLGITQLRFKPAYNPYTEPSMEIFCYHDGLGKWIEIGNSGMFRPEMLLPMGLPENVNVIAWGLSLERPTMIKYGINNIRDLVGPKVDLDMVYNNPLCRLDKGPRIKVKTQRDQEEFSQNFTIFSDPNYPIYSLEILLRRIKSFVKVRVETYVHSSITKLPDYLSNFCYEFKNHSDRVRFVFNVIWKDVGSDSIMYLPGIYEIKGEVNVIRYINRLIETIDPVLLKYETGGPIYSKKIDSYLDEIHAMLSVNEVPKILPKQHKYVMGNEISCVDIILESIRKRISQ